MRSEYAVSLRDLRFHARVGIQPHERELPQPIEIDVTVWPADVPPGVAAGAAPPDYRAIYDLVANVVGADPIDYLEEIAMTIAQRSMGARNTRRVRVVVRKPHVPLPGPLAHAEVVIELSRDD